VWSQRDDSGLAGATDSSNEDRGGYAKPPAETPKEINQEEHHEKSEKG
jgi:hypothetical protein